ncbi:MAG: hypothetical protein IAG13_01165, partial [Deltaproteobacteria bacterium]|nr:hypothetical protein [Nannocystaceae bacterium]
DGDSDCSETCDEAANACSGNDPVGASCNDGLFCTAQDACDGAGTCDGGGTPCAGVGDGDDDCNEGCNEGTDTCTAPDPFGASCNDGLFCTTTDSCDGTGTCGGTGNPCGAQIGDGDSDCTENCNELTDACTAPDPNGVTCNDGLFCTLVDTCQNGSCSGGSSPCVTVGDADGDCSESCDESANACSGNDPNGSSCNDNLFCTLSDFCTNGACGGNGNPCAGQIGDADTDCSESCNETTNLCTNADPNGSACNDGLHCNGADSCSGGVCSGHAGNPCAGQIGDADTDCSESCNEGANACTSNDPNGSACNDNLFCNGADTCSAGVCSGHAGDPCPGPDNDNNCGESCNEGGNACNANDPNASVCNDGLFCTSNDRCNAGGVCVGGANPCDGPDGDLDCSEGCNENSNNCSNDDPNGVTCDHDCFIDGVCTNGACVSTCCVFGC